MNVTLIGMAGVGKSFVGRRLAERLGCMFIDTDELMEERAGKSIQELLDERGDDGFTRLEEETILGLKMEGAVVAPGGSIIYSEHAMRYLKDNSTVVYLADSVENVVQRINAEGRGLVGLDRFGGDVERLFMERLPLYEKWADVAVDRTGSSDDELVDAVVSRLPRR